jgi:hypothetical protein
MLDFYLIDDEQAKPSYPEQTNLEYAGGINLATFEELQRLRFIEDRFDFWTDYRWSNQQVKQKSDVLIKDYPDLPENRYKPEKPEKTLWMILEKAVRTGQGLIAFAD